jgi:pimeloyl-ACP methyl ester carboxylesterase
MDTLYSLVPVLLLIPATLVAWLAVRRARSPATATQPLWRKAAERVPLTVAALALLALALCGVYNAIAIRRFLAANPPLGQLYSVGGRRMHLYCIGAGEPAVVLEAGLGAASDVLDWSPLQTKLARFSRVCSYDRAGMGWSDSADTPRDADHIASDLHALLAAAGVRPPFVLVGSSRGGLYIRDYTAHFPSEVAALLLLDSSSPYQEQRLRPNQGSREWAIAVLQAQYVLGLARLHGWCGHASPGPDQRYAQALAEDNCLAHWSGVEEYLAAAQTSAEVVLAPPFGTLPVVVISRDPLRVLGRPNASPDAIAREQVWNSMQEDLKDLSTHSRRIVARGSSHELAVDRQDLIVREVARIVDQIRDQIRGTAPEPADNRATVVE